ncbi:hypothetical protein [Halocalculus aciditolerans]|uniref:Uncharacterized protein n=1 Tax=Halocalculus aciditolerans TaxID=1383812 RepID=A0A830FR99_9EURY|nr:hypothetical protein [Halocalculus aciditolerans]GGL73746.1 hypothetical protein GCM10009039_34830 [Halocalculus aciditolerans]
MAAVPFTPDSCIDCPYCEGFHVEQEDVTECGLRFGFDASGERVDDRGRLRRAVARVRSWGAR